MHSLIAERCAERPGAVKGAGFSRRSEPLTARTALKECGGRERRVNAAAGGFPNLEGTGPGQEFEGEPCLRLLCFRR